jgi:hypothetical protein
MRRFALLLLVAGLFFVPGCGDDAPSTETPPPPGGPTRFDGPITFTDSWSGEWSVTATFRDCTTGHVVVIEDLVGMLCEGDSLATGVSGLFSGCTGQITNEQLEATCEYTFDTGLCTVLVRFSMTIDRDTDTLAGTGVWSAQTSTDCAGYPVGCEEIEISGIRIGAVRCDSPAPRLPAMLGARAGAVPAH